MVEFYDPISKQNLSYHIDKDLIKKWDKIKNKALVKKDEDRVYIVDGREGVGKSLFAFQQAKYIDPTFNIDRICFSPEEFLYAIRNAPEGSSVAFDEAFRGLSSKASQSKVNKTIVQAMMEMRQKHLTIFIVLPTFFLLELYPAVLRSNALFHLFKDKKGRRVFKVYNYQKKSKLYQVGRKKGFSYSFPKIIKRGQFFGVKPLDWKAYEEKKLKSLIEIDKGSKEELGSKKDRTIDILYKHLYESNDQNAEKTAKLAKELGIEISSRHIKRRIDRIEPEITVN